MKKLLLFAIIIASVASLSACRRNILHGEGPKGTATLTAANFNAIDMDISAKISITVQAGAIPSIQLSGYENVIKHIKVKVVDNTLQFYTDLDETWDIDYDELTAQITVPSLSALGLSGAPDADIHGNIVGDSFNLDISGASKVFIDNINVNHFNTDASGATEIEVRGGVVQTASYDISGAGKIRAFPLQTQESSVSISGAGKGQVTAAQKLTADISGAGTIEYKGHPTVSQDISGAGSIKDVN